MIRIMSKYIIAIRITKIQRILTEVPIKIQTKGKITTRAKKLSLTRRISLSRKISRILRRYTTS